MKIIFIRHGEKGKIGKNPYLTKRGIKQAKHLANRLREENFEEFYCSNMNRSKQTARIISKQIKVKPKIEKFLDEFRLEILMKNKNKLNKKERTHFIGLTTFLKKMAKNPDGKKSILIISHDITNRIILSYFLGLNLKKTMQFGQTEGGINSVYWSEKSKNWKLKIFNDNNYIPNKLKYRESNNL